MKSLKYIAACFAVLSSTVFAKQPGEIVRQVSPSIVSVGYELARIVHHVGSGVVIAPGVVITDCGNTMGERTMVDWKGSKFPADIEAADTEHSLCRLKVRDLNAPPIAMVPSSQIKGGERVYAMGITKPNSYTVTSGFVSRMVRMNNPPSAPVMEISAGFPSLLKGGGLFDEDGQLIGVTAVKRVGGVPFRYALPAEWVSQIGTRQ